MFIQQSAWDTHNCVQYTGPYNGIQIPVPQHALPGALYFDTTTQEIKISDGQMWHVIRIEAPNYQLSGEATDTLIRAKTLLNESETLKETAEKYPIVDSALKQLMVAIKLCQNLPEDQEAA